MLTVGVDLAAEPRNTAVARVRWTQTSAEVQAVGVGADDPVLVEEIAASDKAAIDCPLGWPRRFVEFVAQHEAGAFVAPADVAGKDWRRQLALRQTDLIVRSATGLVPLSVAADRIGLAAMRCAGLLARLASAGHPVDRSGAGVVVEVYPAAALKHWGMTYRSYKGTANTTIRHQLVQVYRDLPPPLEVDLLEAQLDMGAVDDDTRIRLGRVAELRQPGNLIVVVRPDLEVVQRRRPEPSKRRRRGTVDHDLLQAPHRPILALTYRGQQPASTSEPQGSRSTRRSR